MSCHPILVSTTFRNLAQFLRKFGYLSACYSSTGRLFGTVWCSECSDIVFCDVSLQKNEQSAKDEGWSGRSESHVLFLVEMFDFPLLLPFLREICP